MSAGRFERLGAVHYTLPEYYDRRYRTYNRDVAFYVAMLQPLGGPVLEVGVGTGRVAAKLASAGLDVVGVDPSPQMIAKARARVDKLRGGGDVSLHEGAAASMALRRRFPVVIAPFNVLNHVYTPDALMASLAGIRRHLRPHGAFVFDIVMPHLPTLALPRGRLLRGRPCLEPGGTTRCAYEERFDYDPVTQVSHVTMRWLTPNRRRLVTELDLVQRMFFPQEMQLALGAAGFDIDVVYGDFRGNPLDDESDTQVYICRRA